MSGYISGDSRDAQDRDSEEVALSPTHVGTVSPHDSLVAVVETYDDAPDECTLFPADVDEDDVLTTWMTARDGSFVDLTAHR